MLVKSIISMLFQLQPMLTWTMGTLRDAKSACNGCNVQCVMCLVQCAWCNVQGAMCRVQCAWCNVQGTMCRAQCAM